MLLEIFPEGSRAHNHVRRVLNNVAGLGGGLAANGQAINGHDTDSAAIASPSTSAGRGRGWPGTASPSTSAPRGRGRPGIASPSISALRGRGRPATASPSTSAATGRGLCATTPRVVTTPSLPAPILHTSP